MANLQDITNRSEVGTIKPWGKSTAPAGYVLCDGAAISRTDYVDLFTVVGTTYGAGNGSTTFNSLMKVGETTTMTCYVASNNTSYYMTAFKIDGTTITVKWAGGSAPSAATGSGTDVYSMTIMKTADATFTVFGNFTNFA